jgi:hypothetical protein
MNSFSKRFLVALILTTLLLVALIAYSTLLDIPIVYTMGGYDDLPVVVYAAVGWEHSFHSSRNDRWHHCSADGHYTAANGAVAQHCNSDCDHRQRFVDVPK